MPGNSQFTEQEILNRAFDPVNNRLNTNIAALLAQANTWTAAQTFGDIVLTGHITQATTGKLLDWSNGNSGATARFTQGIRIEDNDINNNALEFMKIQGGVAEIAFSFENDGAGYHIIAGYGSGHGSVPDQMRVNVSGSNLWRWTSAVATILGNLVPEADGTRDLGVETTAQWANVWSDLINGADYGYDNGWRSLESETYLGYGPGIAFDFGPHFVKGKALSVQRVQIGTESVATKHNRAGEPTKFKNIPVYDRQKVTDLASRPKFAVTEDFIEFQGRRLTPDILDKLIGLTR